MCASGCGCDLILWKDARRIALHRRTAIDAFPGVSRARRAWLRTKALGVALLFRARVQLGRCDYPSRLRFRYHGNWCGPNWSGGTSGDQPPTDGLDERCKCHDECVKRLMAILSGSIRA